MELTSTFLLYRGLVHHHHRILNSIVVFHGPHCAALQPSTTQNCWCIEHTKKSGRAIKVETEPARSGRYYYWYMRSGRYYCWYMRSGRYYCWYMRSGRYYCWYMRLAQFELKMTHSPPWEIFNENFLLTLSCLFSIFTIKSSSLQFFAENIIDQNSTAAWDKRWRSNLFDIFGTSLWPHFSSRFYFTRK